MPAVSEMDFEAIKQITKLNLKARIYTFARAMSADIDKALECGAHGVIVEVPIGYPKLKYQFKWTWEDVLRKSVEVINYAKAVDAWMRSGGRSQVAAKLGLTPSTSSAPARMQSTAA